MESKEESKKEILKRFLSINARDHWTSSSLPSVEDEPKEPYNVIHTKFGDVGVYLEGRTAKLLVGHSTIWSPSPLPALKIMGYEFWVAVHMKKMFNPDHWYIEDRFFKKQGDQDILALQTKEVEAVLMCELLRTFSEFEDSIKNPITHHMEEVPSILDMEWDFGL